MLIKGHDGTLLYMIALHCDCAGTKQQLSDGDVEDFCSGKRGERRAMRSLGQLVIFIPLRHQRSSLATRTDVLLRLVGASLRACIFDGMDDVEAACGSPKDGVLIIEPGRGH